jgi:hypothetical protein
MRRRNVVSLFSAASRTALLTLVLAAPGAAHPAWRAQDPAPPATPPPTPPAGEAAAQAEPAPAADPFKFSSAAGLISWVVKAQEVESFELVWTVIRGRLAASRQPELRELYTSLTIFKADTPGEPDVTYLLLADPASKTASYSVSPFLLYASGLFERPEADELFSTLQKATVRVTPIAVDHVK